MIAAAVVGGAALLGGAAGSQKDKSINSGTFSNSSNVNLQSFDDLNKGRSGLESMGYEAQVGGFQDLLKLLNSGPGQQEIQANTAFQNDFASQLQSLFNSQAKPDHQANFAEAQKYFAPQQEMLKQQFQDQMTASNRLSARLGRSGNDPILRNKLMQEQSRQQGMLNAEIGAMGMRMPAFKAEQLMGIGNGLANLRQGLASQALQNRQTLLSMGNELANSERNYRLQAAGRSSTGTTHNEAIRGGGFKGAVEGGMGGAAMGMSMLGSMGGMGGMGGSSMPVGSRSVGGGRYMTNAGY